MNIDEGNLEKLIKERIHAVRKTHRPSLERSSYIAALDWVLQQLRSHNASTEEARDESIEEDRSN